MSRVSFLALVFFTGMAVIPFVMWPWASVRYEVPRVWFFSRWVELMGIASVFAARTLQKRHLDGWTMFLVFLFLLLATVSSFLGPDIVKSFLGNYYRKDGLFTLFHFVSLCLLLALFYRKRWDQTVIMTIGLGSFFLSLWTLMTKIDLFGQPNFLAGYLLVTFPCLVIAQRFFGSGFLLFAMGVQSVALLSLGSRAGLIGLPLLWFWWIGLRSRQAFLISLLTGIAFISFVSGFWIWKNQLWMTWYEREVFIPQGRERIIRSMLRGVAARPLFGWGIANADYAFEYDPWPSRFGFDVYVDRTHSLFLEVLVATGFFGFLIFLLIIGRAAALLRDSPFFISFVVLLLHAQTNVTSIAEDMLLWMYVGIAASRISLKSS